MNTYDLGLCDLCDLFDLYSMSYMISFVCIHMSDLICVIMSVVYIRMIDSICVMKYCTVHI